jgi:hypothetical protein
MGFILVLVLCVLEPLCASASQKEVTCNLCMHVLLQSHLCVPLCCRLKLGAVIKLY